MTPGRPDFLGVGYQKAGTNWVFKQLDDHPEIELPPLKELRYFLRPWHIPAASWTNRLFSGHWHYKAYRQVLKRKLGEWLVSPTTLKNDKWYRRFLLGAENDEWYRGLFHSELVSGEFTPAYVLMDESQVADLAARFPDLKIIMMLRDPVERTWSQMKMNLAKHKGQGLRELDLAELQRGMKEILSLTPDYVPTIKLWKKYFPQVFVGLQDDIGNDPQAFLSDLYRFLGVAEHEQGQGMKTKSNEGLAGDIPPEIRASLLEYYLPQKSVLMDYLGREEIGEWIKE